MLFNLGKYVLASGRRSSFIIDCKTLKPSDWEALAWVASRILPPFQAAVGVPRGGYPFADALNVYKTADATLPILIAEDILTTGGSMENFRATFLLESKTIGVVFIARGPVPDWVTPLLVMAPFTEPPHEAKTPS